PASALSEDRTGLRKRSHIPIAHAGDAKSPRSPLHSATCAAATFPFGSSSFPCGRPGEAAAPDPATLPPEIRPPAALRAASALLLHILRDEKYAAKPGSHASPCGRHQAIELPSECFQESSPSGAGADQVRHWPRSHRGWKPRSAAG